MWVKICGIRDVETAENVVSLKPNAVGLNFFTKSPRCVDRSVAAEISAILPAEIESVGLFVNHELNDVLDTAQQCGLTMIQLHGDEPPEFIAELKSCSADVKILRAFRVDDSGLTEVADYLAECRTLGVCLTGCLIDARVDGEFGGTGHTAPWDLLADQYDSDRWPRLIVAGGLHPGNLADAIHVTRPFGVDVASGVESDRGVKDLALVEGSIQAARQADQ
jgi:phosphoribosylanthranilate isomerase